MGAWYSFNDQMNELFGGKVYRLSLSSGCTCPNRDGTLSKGGCIFCSEGGSGDFAEPFAEEIFSQIEAAKQQISGKIRNKSSFAGYMAYFQSFTNTYGDQERLKALFKRAAEHPEIKAISIGTRPDCISDEMIEVLSAINEKKPVFIELGLQTVHEDTAEYINRCYKLSVFEDAFRKLKRAGLRVVVHVIIGLPGESKAMTKETVRYLSELEFDEKDALRNPDKFDEDEVPDAAMPDSEIKEISKAGCKKIDGIKLQLMHVLENTKLAALLPEYDTDRASEEPDINRYGLRIRHFDEIGGLEALKFGRGFTESEHGIVLKDGVLLPQYTLSEYASFIRELVDILPKETAVHRLTGDAPKKLLILPQWTADKKRVLNTIKAEFDNN